MRLCHSASITLPPLLSFCFSPFYFLNLYPLAIQSQPLS